MSRKNQIVGRCGEYLAAAELTRRGFFATPFSGNVPDYDLICVNDEMQSIPIQVKTNYGTLNKKSPCFSTKATDWMHIEFDEKLCRQIYRNEKLIKFPDLIYIMILLDPKDYNRKNDIFFILNKKDLQKIYIDTYYKFMEQKNWHRPRNWKSLHCAIDISTLLPYRDNWSCITTH